MVSVLVNLGLLGVFKYFNFFADSLTALAAGVGWEPGFVTLQIVLPVGISFYTFQTLSYTIDVYRGRIPPTTDFVAFTAYVAFFPQLVAGPIERATNLLPQFLAPRRFDFASAQDGMRQILWGLFKKVVVADTCGMVVDEVFAAPGDFSSLTLALGAVFFAFQIYGDFSGYSDIAIGTSRLFGFSLMRNFAFPYFSRDIAEFWRRWHISLSTWFRDYLYFPLGGSRVSRGRVVRNVFIIFLVSGLWHGANWTFVVWGLLNALYFVPLLLGSRNRMHLDVVAEDRSWPTPGEVVQVGMTFGLTCLAWIFFRADSVGDAVTYLQAMLTGPLVTPLRLSSVGLAVAAVMIGIEWIQRRREHGLECGSWHPAVRRAMYAFCVLAIMKHFGVQREFIYFQF
jgi:D-alanyl-lipoteichoic acid acyltransferase DltB (MBOAT superfamily)